MRIEVSVDPARRRAWHDTLAQRLAADGHGVWFGHATAPDRLPAGLDLLLRLERLIYRATSAGFAPGTLPAGAPQPPAEPDLVIDTTGAVSARRAPVWQVVFDGIPGETGLVGALLDGRVPAIALVDPAGSTMAEGLPAVENPRLLAAGLDGVLARAVGLCRTAVAAQRHGAVEPLRPSRNASRRRGHPATFAAAALGRKVANRLGRLVGADHRWQTGWRRLDAGAADAVARRLAWPADPYRWLPDDGRRFYADPFVFTHAGRTVLFVEDYPYATERGIVSAVDLGPDGPVGTPRPVLERPYHLSYPSVFARDGAIWMIPETTGARTIELYRADPFPDRWVLDRVLVPDVSAGDATLLDHAGRLYLFAATNDDGGSTWDQLSIFSADRLSGPWSPVGDGPVLIDAGCARPAGFVFPRDGALVRPAQDCRTGYGAGLAFCRIDRLDPEGFAQTLLGQLAPDPAWRASGAHTLNTGRDVEVIDRIGPRRG